jgi:hypothetical protein
MSKEQVTPSDLHTLLETLRDVTAQRDALKKRVQFLETVLQQKIVLTEKSYAERKLHFNQMQRLVYELFLKNPGIPFTYAQAQEEWTKDFPHLKASATNVGRRIRELVQAKRLWQNIRESDGIAQFWLKLEQNEPEP